MADAHERSLPIQRVIETMGGATISEIVQRLKEDGHRAARGGPVTYNTVLRALARLGCEPPPVVRSRQIRAESKDIRGRSERYEAFRTPTYSYTPLLDYRPEWFVGSGFDPSAGDGRMLREIVQRGNPGPHHANDIRGEELPGLLDIGSATALDYLEMRFPPACDFLITNPPFTRAVEFVKKARTHVRGPICILQSIAWQGTRKRSEWLRTAGLAFVLNLPRRPKWEVDTGDKIGKNIWDFAWFVFLPGHSGGTTMDWLVETVASKTEERSNSTITPTAS
ncbi:hypothetical protein [Novosphingobium sp. BL-52-GroH]|uniref:hypothetical protein n=1 Tax=Novosphingobium sp. BL-52-GroH TaxID=3349877 RepID=UPI00384DBEDE